jgi:putative ABC transport system permease protein
LLVAAEVALTAVLLVGAGLMLRTLFALGSVNPGFSGRGVVTLRTQLPPTRYAQPEQQAAFFEQLCERLHAVPGVEAAGAVTVLPLRGGNSTLSFLPEGGGAASGPQLAQARVVAGDYFGAMGIPLLRGHPFSGAARAPRASAGEAIVGERLARSAWPGVDPLGKTVRFGSGTRVTVVGVVGDIKETGLGGETPPMLYMPASHVPLPTLAVVARTSLPTAAALARMREVVAGLDHDLPVFEVLTLEDVVHASVASPRSRALLLGCFAGLALLLAALGIYGVVSYAVSQRTREIGVRMALGARAADVMRLVMGQAMRPVLAGLAFGLGLSIVAGRLVASQLFGVRPVDPLTLIAAPALLVAVALVASGVPARRATGVDPVRALRAE